MVIKQKLFTLLITLYTIEMTVYVVKCKPSYEYWHLLLDKNKKLSQDSLD